MGMMALYTYQLDGGFILDAGGDGGEARGAGRAGAVQPCGEVSPRQRVSVGGDGDANSALQSYVRWDGRWPEAGTMRSRSSSRVEVGDRAEAR